MLCVSTIGLRRQCWSCCLSYICSRMPQPCPSCPETRCSHLRHLPTVYWARGQFFSLSYYPDGALLAPRLSRLNREVGDLNSSWVIMGSGSGALSQTLGVAAPSTFSLHRFHLLTFRHQSALLPPSCWEDHPPTHTRTHAHAYVPRQPSGRRNSSNEAILLTTALLWKLGRDDALWAEMFPLDTKCTDAFACWNVSQEVTRWSQLPDAVDHRAVSLKPLSRSLSLICCLWNKEYVRCLQW